MLGRKFTHRFQLHEDKPEADEIGTIGLLEHMLLIGQTQRGLGYKRNAALLELQRQTFLVHGFEKARAHLFVHFKDGALDSIDLIRIEQAFVRFVRFVVQILPPNNPARYPNTDASGPLSWR